MGVVYRAVQIGLDRTVALKLINVAVAQDESFRRRLQRESKLLSLIEHPNVVAFYDAGEAEGQLFLSMRYVDGVDLRRVLAEHGWLAPERCARIVAEVAAGLDAAHAHGLVHRDVKPANVLLERSGGAERAYLSDFGLTKNVQLATEITRAGQWVGTVDYVAPEQIVRREVDRQADVYSLGCVLYETLTGRVPYDRESDAGKLWAHLHAAAPSACSLRPELPVEIDRVIARAMAKDPAQRFPSAGALGRAAIAAAGGEALTAPAGAASVQRAAGRAGGAARAAWRLRPLVVAGVCTAVIAAVVIAALAVTGGDSKRGPQPRVQLVGIGRSASVGRIAADATGTYVLDGSAGTVVRVSASGRVIGHVKVGTSPVDIAVDRFDRRLWVLDRKDETLTEIDPRGMRLIGRPIHVQAKSSRLAVLRHEVVILSTPVDTFLNTHVSLLRVSKTSHRRIGKIVRLRALTPDLIAGGPGVIVTAGLPAGLTTYSPRLAQVSRRTLGAMIGPHGVETMQSLAIDGRVAWAVFSVAAMPDTPGVRFGTSLPGVVVRFDIMSGKRIGEPIGVGRFPRGIAIDEGVVWVASLFDQNVTRIDEGSARVIGQPVGIGPNNGSVAASGGVAWVGRYSDVARIIPPCARSSGAGAGPGAVDGRRCP